MINYLTMVVAGFLAAVLCADVFLTRDAIKRSGGRIVEGIKPMRWFMARDWRAALITVIESGLILGAVYLTVLAGIWFVGIAVCLLLLWRRGKVVIENYRLNTRILE